MEKPYFNQKEREEMRLNTIMTSLRKLELAKLNLIKSFINDLKKLLNAA